MNVIVLDYNEKFLTFLDPELLDITETTEIGGLPTLSVEYIMSNDEEAKRLFKVGNKILIVDHPSLDDRLYVINTKVKRDYFKENNVVFDVEDVLVELNYAPLFSQTDLTTKNGFTINTVNGEKTVFVDYKALKFWFGDFFNIGIVQDCLNTTIQKISPTGTMTKMELLRFIEEHTGNVFVTRYEIGMLDNTIHRYLDFLNPNGNDSNFSVSFEYHPTRLESADSGDVEEEDEVIPAPDILHNVENLQLSVKDSNGEVIDNLQWSGDELHINNNAPAVVFTLKYTKPSLKITVNNRTFNESKAAGIEDESTYVDTNEILINVGGLNANTENYVDNPINTTIPDTILPNHTMIEFVDTYTGTVFFKHELNPMLGDVHTEVLDLAYNTENIEYEVDESDTFNAIAPILSLDQSGGATNGLSYNDLTKIINRWKNLEVTKGTTIPMIVQKVSNNEAPTATYLDQSDPSSNYYIRPLHPQDNIQTGSSGSTYEYWKGTAYWTAPFTKRKGEMFIKIDEETGAEYNQIRTKQDLTNPYGAGYLPKIGQVSTSDEDPYAIYNDVAMKLKDKRFPTVDIEVDVANYRNGNYNNYGLYDKVYVRIPGFEQLVTAIVKKTSKSFHDIGENKVELTNFTVNTRVITKETGLFGDNLSFKYPSKGTLKVTLQDLTSEDVGLANKIVTLTLYSVDDSGTQKFKKAYNKKTSSSGKVTLPLKLNPGDYIVEANFGGDIEYSPSTATYDVNVSGKIDKPKTTKKTTKSKTTKKYKTTKRYWSKYGEAPDNKRVMAVGRASAPGELGKYGYGFYEAEYENVCPKCHKKGTLFWDIFYAGNETTDYGHVRKTGNGEGGSAEGHIFCSNPRCDGDWSIYGKEHGYTNTRLKRKGKLKKSSKKRAYTLRNGKMLYDTVKVEIKQKKNTKKNTSHKTLTTINSKVKEKALKLATGNSDFENAKKIAKWCGPNIHYGYSEGFTKTPVAVLNSRNGNCCSQTQLMLQMLDAAGVTESYDLYYVFVCCNAAKGVGHVFAKMVNKTNGKWWYVDPCKADPWHHYVTGWGSPPGRRQTKYPTKPF